MRQQKASITIKSRRSAGKAQAAPLVRLKAQKAPAAAPQKQRKGLAVMSLKDRCRIATMGGLAISRNKRHMSAIGTVGGTNRTLTPDQRAARVRSAARKARRVSNQ